MLLEAAKFGGDCYAAVNHEPVLAWAVIPPPGEAPSFGKYGLLKASPHSSHYLTQAYSLSVSQPQLFSKYCKGNTEFCIFLEAF